MREPKAPTLEEMLAELQKKAPPSPGGRTTSEWAEAWGIGYTRTIAMIKAATLAGKMTCESELRPEILRPHRRVRVWLHRFVATKRGKR